MTASPTGAGAFRVLLVCSGNVCRSPLAERVLRARLRAALGPAAAGFRITSAGTRAMVGEPMDARAAAVARSLGAEPDGFAARSVTAEDVAGADLVLAAAREHRAAAVRLHPAGHRYAFTVREFARLAAALPVVPGTDPVERARALVAAAAARRGLERPERPEDDDVADPHGGQDRVHRDVGSVLDAALAVVVARLAGPLPPAVPAGDGEPVVPAGEGEPVAGRAERAGGGTGRDAGRRRSRRGGAAGRAERTRRRRVLRLGVLAGLVLLVTGAGWLAVRGLAAQRELVVAREDVVRLRTALLAGDLAGARASLADAQRRADRARALTADPAWRLAAAPPYVGDTPRAVAAVAAAVDDFVNRALPPMVAAGAALDPARLRPDGDRIAVDALTGARPAVATAAREVAAVSDRLDGVDPRWAPAAVTGAVAALRSELDATAATLAGVDRAARLAPAMLGADGRRRYLVAFQNNAEARGTGGLLGLYGIVSADRGRLRLERLGSNTDLSNAPALPVDLGPAYRARWGDDPAMWVNGNLDPHFPHAARVWLALWKRQTGQRLDGVLATDPVAFGYLLRATGPVRLPSGERVTADGAVGLTMMGVYARFAANGPRDAYMRAVARTVVEALLSGRGNPRALLSELSRAAGERRLLLYSARPGEQRELAGTALAGTLPDGAGPYAHVVVNNAAGSKMDYYLLRSLTYTGGPCRAGWRSSRIEVVFGNAAPADGRLPAYVTLRLDRAAQTRSQSRAPAAIVDLVSVYGPRRAGVVRATLDGRPMVVTSGTAAGRPVWGFPLVVPPGGRRTLVLDITEPASDAAPVIPVQPLVRDQAVRSTVAACG